MSVQFGVQLAQDIVKAVDAKVVDLATFPTVLATRVTQLLLRETIQTVCCALHGLHLRSKTLHIY